MAELHEVRAKAADRARLLGEILQQHEHPLACWAGLLAVPHALPRCWDLVVSAQTVARFVSVWCKSQSLRPRPVELSPSLLPPIPTPRTPSFPGGHATEARLIHLCITLIEPDRDAVAHALSQQVAENRVVAGLNYPSDGVAGQSLAGDILPLLLDTERFSRLLEAARLEWRRWEDGGLGGFAPTVGQSAEI